MTPCHPSIPGRQCAYCERRNDEISIHPEMRSGVLIDPTVLRLEHCPFLIADEDSYGRDVLRFS